MEAKKVIPVSCLGSCYARTDPVELYVSIHSLFAGSVCPDEVILVIDGVIDYLLKLQVEECIKTFGVKAIFLTQNSGLGIALREGLKQTRNEIVARYDTDDISSKERLEIQYKILKNNDDIAVCGSNVVEYGRCNSSVFRYRLKCMPDMADIKTALCYRNPINHPSVMMRKEAIIAVGSYQNVHLFEDYDLWMRLVYAKRKYLIVNIKQPLVIMKRESIGTRRNGVKYSVFEVVFAIRIARNTDIPIYVALSILIRSICRLLLYGMPVNLIWRSKWHEARKISDFCDNDASHALNK